MVVHEHHRQQIIRKDRGEVFVFYENPLNLAKITPPALGFKILTPTPIKMGKGCLIDYRIKILGFPLRWTSLITEYDPPFKFVDVQLKGPYSFWHHAHIFKDHPEGTLIEDVVHYCLPGGVIGRWVQHLLVARQLDTIFDYRNKMITALFE